MSWQDARRDGEALAAAIMERIRAAEASEDGRCGEVRLAEFADLVTYQFLKPSEKWPWRHHSMVIRAAARALRRDGLRVKKVTLDLKGFLDYLAKNDLKNTEVTRAQYLSLAE